MMLSPYHQSILQGVAEDREEGKSDAEILEAVLSLLAKIVSCVDTLDTAVTEGGLRETIRCSDRLIALATEAYNLLGG